MRTVHFPLLLSALLAVVACDDATSDEPGESTDTGESGDVDGDTEVDGFASPELDTHGLRFQTGKRWGRCHAEGWGCDGGSPGVGYACLRPVSDHGLNICVPQTWDPLISDDCTPPEVVGPDFGLGIRLQGSAYCVPDCETDADCEGMGRMCSPQSHFCAYADY